MAGFNAFQLIWIGSASIVAVGWLICSFTEPSPRRAILEWACATAMYVGLETLFVSLLLDARAAGNTIVVVAFGFLCVLFGGGLVVSLWHTLTSIGGPPSTESSATN